jgi:TolA-binding protein
MKQPLTCPRQWEAEALQDGRLDGIDRASFERHTASCASCRREVDALSALAERLSKVVPPPLTPLERQRMRSSLLSVANTRAIPKLRALIRWPGALALIATMIVGGTAIVMLARVPSQKLAVPVDDRPAPLVEVNASSDAVWTSDGHGSTTSITVRQGRVSFTIQALEREQRFLVRLPDGDLDVEGPRVDVSVEGNHTREVTVLSGRAVLHRRGELDLRLGAGDTWSRREPAATGVTPAESLPDPSNRPIPSSQKPAASVSEPSYRAGTLFGAAMTSFEASNYARADDELRQFSLAYPTDPRSEDAAYLRAVAQWRLGNQGQARALARAYLERYPNGLRRPEAQQLVASASDASL